MGILYCTSLLADRNSTFHSPSTFSNNSKTIPSGHFAEQTKPQHPSVASCLGGPPKPKCVSQSPGKENFDTLSSRPAHKSCHRRRKAQIINSSSKSSGANISITNSNRPPCPVLLLLLSADLGHRAYHLYAQTEIGLFAVVKCRHTHAFTQFVKMNGRLLLQLFFWPGTHTRTNRVILPAEHNDFPSTEGKVSLNMKFVIDLHYSLAAGTYCNKL